MHFGDALQSSLQSIFSHKLRSFLTLLGIMIGVMAVVTMFSSVYALKTMIAKNMEGMGWNNSLLIIPGNIDTSGNRRRDDIRRVTQNIPKLSYQDYVALRDELDYKTIYGMIYSTEKYRVRNKDNMISMRAVNQLYFKSKNYDLLKGRFYGEYEENSLIPVCILGYYFAEEHFPNVEPLGRILNLGNHRFKIIGVLDKDGLNSDNGMNFNNFERNEDLKALYIPLNYGATYFSPAKTVTMIYVQSKDSDSYPLLQARTRQILLSRHNMYPNFSFMDIGSMMLNITTELEDMMKKWNITLSAIASISLIVGGIGLFSTLLISIQERMMEIGVRKSIGATDRDIFVYFIFEALSLASLGALLGIMLAWLAMFGMSAAFKISMHLPPIGVLLGSSFALLIGFLSGLYPALKASNIDPIKAIYYFD